jgi:hypothetical protein
VRKLSGPSQPLVRSRRGFRLLKGSHRLGRDFGPRRERTAPRKLSLRKERTEVLESTGLRLRRGERQLASQRRLRAPRGESAGSRLDELFGSRRERTPCPSPRRSSDIRGARRGLRTSEGPDAVFGAQRDGQPDRNRRDLRIAQESRGSSRARAASVVIGAGWGARRKRRGLRATAWMAGQTEPTGPSGSGSAECSSGANGASVSRALGCGLRISGAASAVTESERDRSNRLEPSGSGKASERFGRRGPSGSRRAG